MCGMSVDQKRLVESQACCYCGESLIEGLIDSCLGTGTYVKCPQCNRWQLIPIQDKGRYEYEKTNYFSNGNTNDSGDRM